MVYDILIEIGIAVLLIYLPLAFGGMAEGTLPLMELWIALLMVIWLFKAFAHRHQDRHHPDLPKEMSAVRVVSSPIWLPCGLLLGLILLQCLPLPQLAIRWLSPATYRLYADAAATINVPLPAFLPLSVCSYATMTEWRELLAYIMVFALMVHNIRSPRQIRRLALLIIAVGLFESLYGMVEYFSGRHQIFFIKKTASLMVSGTFVNKNHFAGYLELVIPLAFSVLFARLNERSQASSKWFIRVFDEKYMKILLTSFILLILIAGLFLSGSRGGIISFTGGMACLLLISFQQRHLRKKTFVVLCLFLFAGVIAFTLGHDALIKRLQTLQNLDADTSLQLRLNYWSDALTITRHFPAFGSGFGTFAHIQPMYQRIPSELTVEYAENDYLQTLSETGIFGMILVLSIILLYVRSTWSAWKRQQSRWAIILTAGGFSALCSLLIHSAMDFNLQIPSNACLFTVIAAMTTIAAHSRRRLHSSS
ncbi:hypothetical protein U14_03165 [Candidatus Moduliflexus flocculans]|uniref:O-antigen ligase-related domain-containing protein n=1 Tax=Candidatus Moduliflexus flocculans TaxID=1499966 RepID=A0A081BNF3_9BACT|nr:hypothetical protein U14_03165 [Candidatus Moduliflexus flocculans]